MKRFYFDTHMHFDLYKNRKEVLEYIEINKSYTIAVTNLPDIYGRYYGQNTDFKYVRVALGFHPELAEQYQKQLESFAKYVNTTRYIGEVGLDFSKCDESAKKEQLSIFSEIVNLCNNQNKIMSVHSRRAEANCLKVLDNFSGKVILHWYSGSEQWLKAAIERGYYFSINHQMTVTSNGRKIITHIPLDRLLIESDAPFTKGLNENYTLDFIELIYDFISKEKGIKYSDLSTVMRNNFIQLLS